MAKKISVKKTVQNVAPVKVRPVSPPSQRRSNAFDSMPNEIQNEMIQEEKHMLQNGLESVLLGDFGGTTGFSGLPGGYGNGCGSQLSQVNTLFKNNRWYLISNMRQILCELYVEHGLIQAFIDVPVDDGLRGGVGIKSKQMSEEQLQKIEMLMERQDIMGSSVGQALKWNRLFGGAAVIVITDQDPSTPLDMNAIDKNTPLEFRAVDMWELFWDKQADQGFNAANIENDDFETYSYYGVELHKTRVMKMKGIEAPSFIRPRLRGWGVSIVESVVRSVNQYLKNNDLTFEVLDEFKIDVYKIKNLTNALTSPDGEDQIRRRVALANSEKNFHSAITMDSEDDFDHKQLSFAGLAEIMKEIKMQIAADLRMPMSKIFGIAASGFSSGEDDIENYNAMVESQVRAKCKYDILRIIELMCQKEFGFIPDDLTIEFAPLRVMSAEQEENVKEKKFNRLMQAYDKGLCDVKSFKEGCNKDDLLPIQLDTSEESIFDTPGAEGGEDDKNMAADDGANQSDQERSIINSLGADTPRIVTVGLRSDNHILSGKRRDNNLWTSPGGHMDKGETPTDAALREVLEETGLRISRSSLKHISSQVITSHRTGKEFELHAFIADIPGKPVASNSRDPDQEVSEWKWVKINQNAPELTCENRHAKNDLILNYLFDDRLAFND